MDMLFILHPQHTAFDFAGPAEVIHMAAQSGAPFRLRVAGPEAECVNSLGVVNRVDSLPATLADGTLVFLLGTEDEPRDFAKSGESGRRLGFYPGQAITKMLPPCSGIRQYARPPRASAIALTTARPRPLPLVLFESEGSPRRKASKTLAAISVGRPGPWSSTLSRQSPSEWSSRTLSRPGACRNEFSSRPSALDRCAPGRSRPPVRRCAAGNAGDRSTSRRRRRSPGLATPAGVVPL